MSARFNIKPADPSAVELLQRELQVPRFIATTLAARGLDTVQKAREFMSPSLERDWRNPYEIPGMQEVVDTLESAVRQRRSIVVFGDFDLDGISAATVLTRGLRVLGGDAMPFVPLRNDEGYGISEAAIERCMELSPDVLVTVDCGISNREEANVLKRRGVEVLITDHHEPGDLVPQGVPVCDPKLDPDCPSSILAGVGVALSCVQALGARFGQPHLWREYTDIATLGTIADLVPLRDANRALVADGVKRMGDNPRPCIAALLESAGVADKPVTATSLSFSAIPRLNAAGRMGDAGVALNLLLADDLNEAADMARKLESVNDQRRTIEVELAEIASLQAKDIYHGQRALVVSGEGWHEGVKGIVASRLVRNYGVPCLLFAIDEEGEARGSGRSVGSVNLFKAVESCSDLLTKFGGHEAAVGVTLPASKLPEFTECLCAYMDTLPDECFHPRVDIDARVNLAELTLENVEALQALAPFGQENRAPRFLAQDVLLTRCRAVGADKTHFSCMLTDGASSVAGIMFHCPDINKLMQCGSVVNAAFEVQIDEWRGRKSVKAMIASLSPVKPCAALEACLDPESNAFISQLFASDSSELDNDAVDGADELEQSEQGMAETRGMWVELAKRNPAELKGKLLEALIGEGELHDAQAQALEALERRESALVVMATGRGKSLIFQLHAAMCALRDGKASLLVYPLRALIADQAYHLRRAYASFGLSVELLTGESTPQERTRVYEGLKRGMVDVVLTTPEYLSFHAQELAESSRIGFVVVDEAHHIAQAKAGNRPAYANLGANIDLLGDVTVLALTATAGPQEAQAIESALGITTRVLDRTDRPNLAFDDQRQARRREQCLATLVAAGEKTVVYVNSRQQSVALARTLRSQVPQMGSLIGFYNAGLSRGERKRVEDLFRRDLLQVLVSTSAFGEGVNIPHIRHVVLYNMPFNEIEFNQMSGRAGRDGEPATIHVLFESDDAQVNEHILRSATPDHDTMAQIYRQLRALQKKAAGEPFSITNAELAEEASKQVPVHAVGAESVECALAVFRELGLVEVVTSEGDGHKRRIRVPDAESKVELTDSVRYREGLDEIEVFATFRDWVTSSTAEQLHRRIMAPILPTSEEEGR